MTADEYKIHRRQAIGFSLAACGSAQFCSVSAQPRLGCGDELASHIRELHWQLFEFNREIVPRMVDGRGNSPAYDQKRAERFLHLSLYLRRKLDQRSSQSQVAFDATLLRRRLKQLHVRSRLDCSRFDDAVIQHPANGFLRDQQGNPGHAFASLAWGSSLARLIECAEEICLLLESPQRGMNAIGAVRDASIGDLELAFASMDRGNFLELVEALFMIRPETPVSLLQLHSRLHDGHLGYASVMSCICGNLMERLANNHFHQTVAISRLSECNGSWHGFIAGQVFDILVQKWLWLMHGERSREPIEMEEAGGLSLAMQRGVVEGMLGASAKEC